MPHVNSRHDPVGTVEIERAKHEAAVAEFNARTVSDAVFRATLYGLGFRGAALACEFRYHDDLRHENEKQALKEFKALKTSRASVALYNETMRDG